MSTRSSTRQPGAFTLVEMIIVVGAVALIGLGVARVFQATGDTVTTGRRISRVNQTLALLERRIREDVTSMSRDGFLLIRNEQVGDARIDEIVFFGNGNFVSQREPLHPQLTATSNTARIYWGHGAVHDDSIDDIDVSGNDGESNPRHTPGNPEAGPPSEWALLRHITLLAMPSQGELDDLVPEPPANWFQNAREDSRLQIRLNPAAPSIFRVFNDDYPFTDTIDTARVDADGDGVPRFESGLVDIAATNLDEIRSFILDAQGRIDEWIESGINVPDDRWGTFQPYSNPGDGDSDLGVAFTPAADFSPRTAPGIMQAWMRQALPANSDGSTDGFDYNFNERRRIRCLRRPFDPFDMFEDQRPPTTALADQVRFAQRRADEQALLASVIVPRCSSFKIEWSFGQNYDARDEPNLRTEITWHDLEENSGPDQDNLYNDRDFNPNWRRGGGEQFKEGVVPYVRRDGKRVDLPVGQNGAGSRTLTIGNDPWIVSDELIHGRDDNSNELREPGEVAYSYFGYVDPTYPSADAIRQHYEQYTGAGSRLTPDEELIDKGMPPTMPWAWPKLLRFTIQVVDENEPGRPQTIQFVVELPDRDA